MLQPINALLLIWAAAACGVDAHTQTPLQSKPAAEPRQVAIIGAGSAGASTAYYLRQFADDSEIPLNITVFERSHYVGGRSTTVNVFNDPKYPVELGASIFVSVNYNLMEAAKKFDLQISTTSGDRPKQSLAMLGIWDGERFVYSQSHSMTWWDMVKLLWKYGLAPIRTQRLMKQVVGKFLNLYKPPYFPFSLSSAVVDLELHKATAVTGAQFLEANGISGAFPREIIQASTRVNYGQNLGLIHGLETMVCMATDGAVAVENGNWRIFSGMLDASGAKVALNTTVTSINRKEDDRLSISHRTNEGASIHSIFDEVVIAAPYQTSKIDISPSLEQTPDKIPYVRLYVTLFASRHQVSRKYFNLSDQNQVPEMILTTLPEGVDLGSREDGVGPTGFWSVSLLRVVDSPTEDPNHPYHYVYKVFSPQRLSAEFVTSILGLDVPALGENAAIGDLPSHDVSWFHEKTWDSYPYEYPRQTFEETKLASNIWYTGGIESFISTMETSSLMGMNVAGLMANEWHEQTGRHMSWNGWFEKRDTEL